MPPLFVAVLGAIGVAALVKVIASESRRVNDRMDRQRSAEDGALTSVPLERDPETGTYRPRKP